EPWSLLRPSYQPADFAPSDELDVVLAEQAVERLGGEKVEVALTPRGPPAGVIKSYRAHLLVVEGEVNHKLRHARLQFLDRVRVELRPPLRRDVRANGDDSVNQYVVGPDDRGEGRRVGQRLFRHAYGQAVVARDPH